MRSSVLFATLPLLLLGCSIEGNLGGAGLQPDGFEDDDDPPALGAGGRGTEGSEDEPGPGDLPDPGQFGGAGPSQDHEGGAGHGGGGGGAPTPTPLPNQVCFPGADQSYTTCFPTVLKDASFPSGYTYPTSSSPAYAAPTRFIDLNAHPSGTKLAPNFSLGELMQAWKGRYAIYEPHMVDKLQSLRNQSGGALNVNSGYRSPGYNTGVDGATFSRHMYGDAADMASSVVSLNTMKGLCQGLNADYIGMYTSHIHCDWRYTAKDPAFFNAAPPASITPAAPHHDASFYVADGFLRAEVSGFDEGEPYREWTAFDAEHRVLEVEAADDFRAPAGTVSVEVMIGGQLTVVVPDLAAPTVWHTKPEAVVRLETLPREGSAHQRETL